MSETGFRERRKAGWETTMETRQQQAMDWEGWLAAESAGESEEAEARLLALFAQLDSPAPAAGFADRVVARATAEAPRRSARRRFARRALAGGLLAAAGVAVALLLPALSALVGLVDWAALPGLAARLIAMLAASSARALGTWQELLAVLRPVARALAHPQVVGALVGLVAVSSLALASLARALERGKGARHVASFG